MSSQRYRSMADRLVRVCSEDPILVMNIYCVVSEIVDDFEDYDGLVPSEHGTFDETTAIIKLQRLRNELMKRLDGRSS